MATIAENLQILKDSTYAIKQAIIDKGGTVDGDISTWANSIVSIVSGETEPKEIITNKLYNTILALSFTHTYTFNSEVLNTYIILPNTNYYSSEYFNIDSIKNVPIFLQQRDASYSEPYVLYKIKDLGTFNFESNDFNIQSTITLNNNELNVSINTSEVFYTNLACQNIIYFCVIDADNNFDYDVIFLANGIPCILKNSLITLSNNTKKLIQDITYNDELLVWNFDECKYDKAKPLWIKKVLKNNWYYKLTFSDGNILKVTGIYPNSHRLFNYSDLRFDYANKCIGKLIYTTNGIVTLESCEYVEEIIEHYNIITDYHMNLFANNILTSCRYNNLYPIKDMLFVKDNRDYKNISNYNENVKEKYFLGLRLLENQSSVEDDVKYVNNLLNYEYKKN